MRSTKDARSAAARAASSGHPKVFRMPWPKNTFRRTRAGHSPSTRPTRCRSSKSPKGAAARSTSITPASPPCGVNVSLSIQRRTVPASSSSLPPEIVVVSMRRGEAVEDREHAPRARRSPFAEWIVQRDRAAEHPRKLTERGQQCARGLLDGQRRQHADHGRGRHGQHGRPSPSSIADRAAARAHRSPTPLPAIPVVAASPPWSNAASPMAKRGDGVGGQLEVRCAEHEVRRSEQGDERRRGEAGGDGGENQIQRGGERLGGQRQRVARLQRHAAGREHASRQIHVRQRPPNDNAHPIEQETATASLRL